MLPTLLGISGTALILYAFSMNQTRRWSTEDLAYDALNAVGSLLLIAYSILLSSIPFLILNGVWAIVSIRDVLSYTRRKR
ncbi:TPA: hypothetical protein HA361_04775 [Candidatus Woesearchaeota archaeon]|nr:hypothetical protein [Candidatus Woesearchaeota archaeon]HII69225.1 hypothetical protein [Candidatus Woesearchaeota archaeon]